MPRSTSSLSCRNSLRNAATSRSSSHLNSAQLVAFLGENLANGFHRDPERVVSGPLDPGGDIVRLLLAERIRRRYRCSAALPLSNSPDPEIAH